MTLPQGKQEMTQVEASRWFKDACNEIARMVTEKRLAYGDNLSSSHMFLKALYPKGIPPEAYGEALVMVRIFDKFKRRANKHLNPEGWTDQENPWIDVAGYAVAVLFDIARGTLKL